ncbi:MurR/RpiR family transcriptional regulator [Vallitalea okinawensis]|uniref:MurR/RpiR family transcriptional regulator n=1 Tax=Vallitalea okinawensis TaxID=2078660 RepID=UPI000CFB2215|nr:MurR/RpiR family transcriptional regulator [Vallitalea okinawensis]
MPSYQNPYLILKNLYPNMYNVEKKIADFILENKGLVSSMTIAHIAKELKIAESSIVRFSQTLGYSGFTALKLSLVRHSDNSSSSIYEDIDLDDDMVTVTKKVFNGNISVLQDSLNMIDFEKIKEAIDAIDNAKKIIFYGVGSSSTIANDFYYRFMRIGLPAQAITDPHISYLSASLLDEDCVAIAISHTGRTKEIIDNMKMAKSKNATTISVTSFLKSPLNDCSDIVLCISSKEIESLNEAIASRIAHITLLDSIYAGLALKRKDKVLPLIQNMNDILQRSRL